MPVDGDKIIIYVCFTFRSQKRLCLGAVLVPLLVLASLVTAVLVRAATVQETFQRMTLGEDDLSFLDPSQEQIRGGRGD